MPERFKNLIDQIRSLNVPDSQSGIVDQTVETLKKLEADFFKTTFKYERSNKDKNILMSLLTRTTKDLKEVSDKLRNRAEELSILLATIPAYVFFKDNQLRYFMVNQPFAELFGFPPEYFVGRKFPDILKGYTNEEYFMLEQSVLDRGDAIYNIEEEIVYQNRKRWVSTNLAPIRNASDEIIGLIGISWDVTDRKMHETELRESKEAAEAGTLAKNEFIASVSHEFRTPMNGILGLADILLNSGLNQEQIDLVNGITVSAQHLLVLLNDVLDFSAIEAGKMQLDHQPFMLNRVLEDIAMVTKRKAEEKSLAFILLIDPEIPDHLVGDAHRLKQILINLISNAVKFTESGKIEIRVTLEEKFASHNMVRFAVSDSGVGIPHGAIDSLFKVFSRVRQDKTRLIAGTGLGLSICKKLTDMMGGKIGVESTLGKGSTFWFTLPFDLSLNQRMETGSHPAEKSRTFAGKNVLVAEDNPINQRIVHFQLQKMGFRIDLTNDGQEALEKFVPDKYDIIILDIQMPRMDGYQAAKAIRLREKEQQRRVPIIALTANAMKGDREKYLDAGMDGYVSKPFTFETLFDTIDKLIRE